MDGAKCALVAVNAITPDYEGHHCQRGYTSRCTPMKRLSRLIQTGRVDPTLRTTHTFRFDQIEKAFHMMETGEDGIIKLPIDFE